MPVAPELIVNQGGEPLELEAVQPQFDPLGVTVIDPEPPAELKSVLLLVMVKLHSTPA